jgi:hypothetical protein
MSTTNNTKRYEANKERKSIVHKKWSKSNRHKANATVAKYKATKLRSTPKWLTEQQLLEIQEFYLLAQELAWLNQDGSVFHVDHIVPLQGKNVSGLHVPWNLQLLHYSQNSSKGNRVK